MDYIIPVLVAFITAVLGPLAMEWAKAKFKSKPKKSPIQEALEMNELVDHQLDLILETIECDRVWIIQFHNGGHFYPTGKSIQKFSMFYEKITTNASSIQHTFQNIPVSLFPKSLGKIYKDGELSIPTFTEGETYDLEAIAKDLDTKSFYAVGLYSLDDHLIGVMGIGYYNKEHKLTKDEWIFVRQKVGVIGTLLTDYLKSAKK
jgi:GAF domain-containing protein